MLSADIDGEQESVELPRDIAEIWLTIILWIFNYQSLDFQLPVTGWRFTRPAQARLRRKASHFAKPLSREPVMLMKNNELLIDTVLCIFIILVLLLEIYSSCICV